MEKPMLCVYAWADWERSCDKPATIHVMRHGPTPDEAGYHGESFCCKEHLRKYFTTKRKARR